MTSPLRLDAPHLLAAGMALIDQSFGIAMLGCFLASVLLGSAVLLSGGPAHVGLWCAAMGLACAFGHLWRRRNPARVTPAGAQDYARWMTALLIVLGSLWGLAGCVYMDLESPPSVVSALALIAGMSAAALSIFSPCLPVAIGFFFPAILPVWAYVLVAGGAHYLWLWIGIPLYLLVLTVFARNYALVARRSILLRFENLELVEQLRAETLRAEEANRAKSVFLAAASHDLRQPLHALGLFIASLRRTPLDEGQTDLLTHMDGAARAAGEMLNTLLDFSRLEAGVIEANPQPFPLQPMLRKLEAEFAPQAEQKQLVFRLRDTPAICHTDPSLLELVLRNLIANAVRYTERGGLLIACRRPRAGLAVIEVWDTGIGIPSSQHEAIFQAFHQLGNPERDRRHGLGLGLAIVRQLARTMDLALSLASRPGRGSVFRVAIPCHADAPSPPWPAAATTDQPRDLQRLRVLVIDDDQTVLCAMRALLESWNCDCRTAESEAAAIDCLHDFEPAVIITDYRLRGHRTGHQALDAIRAFLQRRPPVILMTGDTAPDRLREAMAGGVRLLHKPISADTLLEAVLQLAPARPD